MLYHSKIHFCSRKFKTKFFVNFKKGTHTFLLLFLCSNWFRKLEKTWINAGIFLLQTSKKITQQIFTRNRIVKEIFNKRPKKSPTFSNAVMYYCRQRTVGKYRCVSSFIASLVSPLLRVPPSLEISWTLAGPLQNLRLCSSQAEWSWKHDRPPL